MKIKTSELTGPALDWAVAKCEGKGYELIGIKDDDDTEKFWLHTRRYSTDWSQGGPIIEREQIEVIFEGDCWIAMKYGTDDNSNEITEDYPYGLTALIAAMRCYVASKLGDEVDVPDELINN